MYEVIHNLCPRTICNMFYTNSHTYSLRQRDFHLPRFNTFTYGKHSIRYLGLRLWSKLTNKERSIVLFRSVIIIIIIIIIIIMIIIIIIKLIERTKKK